jgi:hypothetical protein
MKLPILSLQHLKRLQPPNNPDTTKPSRVLQNETCLLLNPRTAAMRLTPILIQPAIQQSLDFLATLITLRQRAAVAALRSRFISMAL